MSIPFTQLYVHLVWSTWDRLPLISDAIKPRLLAVMAAKCRELGASAIVIGLMPDHAHLLARIPPTLAVATLAKEVKGSSSHFVNHVIGSNTQFKWQGGYGAFTVGARGVSNVKAYIANQARHHADGTAKSEWEVVDEDRSAGLHASRGD